MDKFWALVKLLPELIKAAKAFISLLAEWSLKSKKAKNKETIEKVENANTTEDKQRALDGVAGNLGSN